MDWIDEFLEKQKKKIQNLPITQAAWVYFLLFFLGAGILTFLTVRICERRSFMWQTGRLDLSESGIFWLGFFERWSGYLYLGAGVLLMLRLFYKNRLKKPLEILKSGMEEIRRQNLEFSLVYDSEDEMGELCASFEKMRKNLVREYERLWEAVENQKQLNAAFAHDLRTPLTVIKGYSEFLTRYLPQGKVSREKEEEILRLMIKQMERLTEFSKTMKSVRSLDEYPVQRETVSVETFFKTVKGIAKALDLKGAVQVRTKEPEWKQRGERGLMDENLILEVLDNLLSNAIRYAESEIEISIETEEKKEGRFLYLYVEDNGPGFAKDERERALRPYYSQDTQGEHFGIGLHICSKLCRAHKGTFSIANRMEGRGALVCASFFIS